MGASWAIQSYRDPSQTLAPLQSRSRPRQPRASSSAQGCRKHSQHRSSAPNWKPRASAHCSSCVVLVGLPGSGKSSFCDSLLQIMMNDAPNTTNTLPCCHVVCQDVLGTRLKCEKVVRTCLQNEQHVIVDRTNITIEQRKKCQPTLDDIISRFDRPLTLISVSNIVFFTLNILGSHWVRIGKQGNTSCHVVACVFGEDMATSELVQNVKARGSHPTLDASKAQFVVGLLQRKYMSPNVEEGMDNIFYLKFQPTLDDIISSLD